MSILNALRGIGGDFEVQRVIGAFGAVTFIVNAPALVWAGKVQVSFETFCIAYPAGIATVIAACAGSIAWKDRQVAKAKAQTEATP
ncbi:hypothetical protein [Sphingomonas sp.]|uniref:hypothetical protein n=1 Tax=Sphingomonas sp. TaxID=28214 RepID=UPI002FDAA1DB